MIMRKFTLLIALLLGFSSCQPAHPPRTELIAKYTSAPQAFEKLKEMILQDASKDEYFAIGYDNIGYYWEYEGKWSTSRTTKDTRANLSLPEVLKTIGMTESRYLEYVKLFEKTDSERVILYQSSKIGNVVHILLYRAGNVTSGTSANIAWAEKTPTNLKLYGRNDFCGITLLKQGWYLNVECS